MRKLMILIAGLVAFAGASAVEAQAPILIVDNERVESDAAAYKDFALQTAQIRDNILNLRKYFGRGGGLEQEAAQLEQQKSIIGSEEFEKQRTGLEQKAQGLQQQLQLFELSFDRLREKALIQVERARQPVLREMIKERGAQIIIPKRSVLGHASGIDITTEFIERLDDVLSQVDLPELSAQQNNNAESGSDSSSGIEEID